MIFDLQPEIGRLRGRNPLPPNTTYAPRVNNIQTQRQTRTSASIKNTSNTVTNRIVLPTDPNEWFCPHSPLPTDCRICSDETSEQRAIKSLLRMGFTLQQVDTALRELRRTVTIDNLEHDVISTRVIEIITKPAQQPHVQFGITFESKHL